MVGNSMMKTAVPPFKNAKQSSIDVEAHRIETKTVSALFNMNHFSKFVYLYNAIIMKSTIKKTDITILNVVQKKRNGAVKTVAVLQVKDKENYKYLNSKYLIDFYVLRDIGFDVIENCWAEFEPTKDDMIKMNEIYFKLKHDDDTLISPSELQKGITS